MAARVEIRGSSRFKPWHAAVLSVPMGLLVLLGGGSAVSLAIAAGVIGWAGLFVGIMHRAYVAIADERGLYVRNLTRDRFVTWKGVEDFRLTTQPGQRLICAILRNRGEIVPLEATCRAPGDVDIPELRTYLAALRAWLPSERGDRPEVGAEP